LAVHGVARSEGIQFKSQDFSLAQVSLRAPFEWNNGSIHVKDLHLTGKTLTVERKDQFKISAEEILVTAIWQERYRPKLKSTGNCKSARPLYELRWLKSR
jgi:hypothetical protein